MFCYLEKRKIFHKEQVRPKADRVMRIERVCVEPERGVRVGCLSAVRAFRGFREVSLAPLYYPDTLVNPDTCLRKFHKCFEF